MSALPSRLREALGQAGATSAGVVARLVAPSETAASVLDEILKAALGDDAMANDDDLTMFLDLRTIALQEDARLRREPLLAPPWQDAARLTKRLRQRDYDDLERAFRWPRTASSALAVAGRPGSSAPPPVSRTHRTSCARLVASGTEQSRSEREELLRQRYVKEMVDELINIGAPSALEAGRSADPRSTLALLAAGRRASTIRSRLRAWRAFRQWLAIAHGELWPSTWLHILEYCRCRAAEPCGRATLLGVIGGIAFVERAGGYAGTQAHTSNVLFRESCRELCMALSARAGGRHAHQALTILTGCLIRLEAMVVDDAQYAWHRAYAWWKLVQTWAALRFDDHRGLAPSSIALTPEGLEFDLLRTKTTGCGKRVERRPSGVSRQAYLVIANWLECGWALWQELAPYERDYFLVAPRPDLQQTVARELKYGEAAGWSRALLRLVLLDLAEHSVIDATAAVFTEHSGRSFVVSAALALGAADSHLLPVGGWAASPARAYMRTARRRLLQVQQQVARHGRDRLGAQDEYGEGETLRKLKVRLLEGGHAEDEVDKLCSGLRVFPEAAGGLPLWKAAAHGQEENVDDGAGPGDVAAPGAQDGLLAAGAEPQGVRGAGSSDDHNLQGNRDSAVAGQVDQASGSNPRLPSDAKGYVVSISKKTGYRRLHALGRCYRVPGVDYAQFELLGEEPPAERLYDGYCAQCWKAGSAVPLKPPSELAGGALADESPASVDDSSSTDSDSM